jgi:hypothetical protein
VKEGLPVLQEIVLSVCALVAPERCEDVHLQIAPDSRASLQLRYHCVRQGQIEGQKWIAQHPGWRVERWRCPQPAEAGKRRS